MYIARNRHILIKGTKDSHRQSIPQSPRIQMKQDTVFHVNNMQVSSAVTSLHVRCSPNPIPNVILFCSNSFPLLFVFENMILFRWAVQEVGHLSLQKNSGYQCDTRELGRNASNQPW